VLGGGCPRQAAAPSSWYEAITIDFAVASPPSPSQGPPRQWTRAERMRASIAYWLLVVACLIVAGGGAYLVHLEATPDRGTQIVPATIEHVEVIARNDGHGHTVKLPLVLYSYSINGVRYTTDRLTSRGRCHDENWATDVAHRYHAGETVPAYVSTFDPGNGFLIRDTDWRAYAFLIVPLLIAIMLAVYWPWAGIRAPANL